MNMVIYKDQRYFFKRRRCRHFPTLSSYVNIYVKREGWPALIGRYKRIGRFKGEWKIARTEEMIEKLIETHLKTLAKQPVLLIKCSQDITDIYS